MARWLILSDLQIPFEARDALDFCKAVARDLRVPKENVLCVGDEVDQYWASRWPKDPAAQLTARQEVKQAREKIRQWGEAFPSMQIATSNHGARIAARARDAGMLPDQVVPYDRYLKFPSGWKLKDRLYVRAKSPFQIVHGLGYGSIYAYRQIALDKGISTAFGHLHCSAGIAHIVVDRNSPRAPGNRWGMNTGCLIDVKSYAFAYGKDHKWQPTLSVGAVVDDGLTPLLFRYTGR